MEEDQILPSHTPRTGQLNLPPNALSNNRQPIVDRLIRGIPDVDYVTAVEQKIRTVIPLPLANFVRLLTRRTTSGFLTVAALVAIPFCLAAAFVISVDPFDLYPWGSKVVISPA